MIDDKGSDPEEALANPEDSLEGVESLIIRRS